MVNHETNELFFDNLEIPVENLIGEEGKGFQYILDGLNAERTLIAAECIGDGYWFIDKVAAYAKERTVFGRPSARTRACSSPSRAPMSTSGRQPDALRGLPPVRRPRALRRAGQHGQAAGRRCLWEAANACLQFHGGFGFANEYDVERKFRETRLYRWRQSPPT